MDSLLAKAGDALLSEAGLAGVIILALTVAIVFMWRQLLICHKASSSIIATVERSTMALNTLTAWGEARNQVNLELKEAILAHTAETKALREYIIQLAEVGRERFEQLQRDIDRMRK